MIDIKEYIESGVLEMYVAGTLSDEENQEVYRLMQKHIEVRNEVKSIEEAIVKLTKEVAPSSLRFKYPSLRTVLGFDNDKLSSNDNIRPMNSLAKLGWVASLVIGAGLVWTLNQQSQLKKQIQIAQLEKQELETIINDKTTEIADANEVIGVLKDKEIVNVPLAGQGDFKETYAEVYWDKNSDVVYLDLEGLPTPPEGKVYQIWSLKLEPLTPTSLGTIDAFSETKSKLIKLNNKNASQAFGITLEPSGGSPTPTMDQLYTLGVVSS